MSVGQRAEEERGGGGQWSGKVMDALSKITSGQRNGEKKGENKVGGADSGSVWRLGVHICSTFFRCCRF